MVTLTRLFRHESVTTHTRTGTAYLSGFSLWTVQTFSIPINSAPLSCFHWSSSQCFSWSPLPVRRVVEFLKRLKNPQGTHTAGESECCSQEISNPDEQREECCQCHWIVVSYYTRSRVQYLIKWFEDVVPLCWILTNTYRMQTSSLNTYFCLAARYCSSDTCGFGKVKIMNPMMFLHEQKQVNSPRIVRKQLRDLVQWPVWRTFHTDKKYWALFCSC